MKAVFTILFQELRKMDKESIHEQCLLRIFEVVAVNISHLKERILIVHISKLDQEGTSKNQVSNHTIQRQQTSIIQKTTHTEYPLVLMNGVFVFDNTV